MHDVVTFQELAASSATTGSSSDPPTSLSLVTPTQFQPLLFLSRDSFAAVLELLEWLELLNFVQKTHLSLEQIPSQSRQFESQFASSALSFKDSCFQRCIATICRHFCILALQQFCILALEEFVCILALEEFFLAFSNHEGLDISRRFRHEATAAHAERAQAAGGLRQQANDSASDRGLESGRSGRGRVGHQLPARGDDEFFERLRDEPGHQDYVLAGDGAHGHSRPIGIGQSGAGRRIRRIFLRPQLRRHQRVSSATNGRFSQTARRRGHHHGHPGGRAVEVRSGGDGRIKRLRVALRGEAADIRGQQDQRGDLPDKPTHAEQNLAPTDVHREGDLPQDRGGEGLVRDGATRILDGHRPTARLQHRTAPLPRLVAQQGAGEARLRVVVPRQRHRRRDRHDWRGLPHRS